jgi:membrane protein YqaA with SNARE-associated domain
VIDEGYIGLFFSAFLSATILPSFSEVVVGTMAALGTYKLLWLLGVASVGNTLGSVVNWIMGRYLYRFRDRRWFPISSNSVDRAAETFNRWGLWSLLLAWVPVIGDPLTLVAGLLRVGFPVFLILVAISKTARYALLLGVLDQVVL